jgi:hypothetical protein
VSSSLQSRLFSASAFVYLCPSPARHHSAPLIFLQGPLPLLHYYGFRSTAHWFPTTKSPAPLFNYIKSQNRGSSPPLTVLRTERKKSLLAQTASKPRQLCLRTSSSPSASAVVLSLPRSIESAGFLLRVQFHSKAPFCFSLHPLLFLAVQRTPRHRLTCTFSLSKLGFLGHFLCCV